MTRLEIASSDADISATLLRRCMRENRQPRLVTQMSPIDPGNRILFHRMSAQYGLAIARLLYMTQNIMHYICVGRLGTASSDTDIPATRSGMDRLMFEATQVHNCKNNIGEIDTMLPWAELELPTENLILNCKLT